MKLNIVPARTGIQWVKLGIQTFFRQPLALAGLFVILFFAYMVVVVLFARVPVLGPAPAGALVPFATLAMMVATHEATERRFPRPSILFAALRGDRARVRSHLVLAGISALVMVLLVALSTVAILPEPSPAQGPLQVDLSPALLAVMVLQLPFAVLFSHAPALVHWHGMTPGKALFFSGVAFVRNFGAFLVFGLGWVLFLFGAGFVASLVFGLLGAAPSPQTMLPVALLLLAMMSTSMYFTFRDSFVADDTPEPRPTEETPHE